MYMIPLIFLSLIAVTFIILPYYKSRKSHYHEAPDVGVYKAQLKELDLDIARGNIEKAEAAKVRIEIERRLLKAAERTQKDINFEPVNYIFISLFMLIILSASVLYVYLGNPAMGDYPKKYDQISNIDDAEMQKTDQLIALVKAKIIEIPDDARGWAYLANLQMTKGNLHQASESLFQAHLLEPNNFDYQLMYAESLIMASNERVIPAAKLILNKAALLDPNHAGPKYYLALGQFQGGEVEYARAEWIKIKADLKILS